MKENAKLRGRIIEKYGTQSRFAEKIGKTEQTVTAKLNGNSGFSQDDIVEWSNALEIDADSVGKYFFAHLLSKC
jgi:transcriptional regulator with XRE-family HTH domain